jgi:hypothetical protein
VGGVTTALRREKAERKTKRGGEFGEVAEFRAHRGITLIIFRAACTLRADCVGLLHSGGYGHCCEIVGSLRAPKSALVAPRQIEVCCHPVNTAAGRTFGFISKNRKKRRRTPVKRDCVRHLAPLPRLSTTPTLPMKTLRFSTLLIAFIASSFALRAQIVATASVTPNPIFAGQSVTIMRDGQADAGIAYCEGTIWAPDGTYDTLGQAGLGPESYTPHSGPGIYWLQFRLVDNNVDFVDQWISFVVNPSGLAANASISTDFVHLGDSLTINRDGVADAGLAYTEVTIWTPEGIDALEQTGFESETYTPHDGPGQYWVQFRVVDDTGNYVDQWIGFYVDVP